MMCCLLVSPLDPAHSWCKREVLYSPANKLLKVCELLGNGAIWLCGVGSLGQSLRSNWCCVSVADFVPALKDSCDRLIQDFR